MKIFFIGLFLVMGGFLFVGGASAELLYSGEGPRIYGRLHETGAHTARVRWSTGDSSITWIKYGETVYLDQEVKEEGIQKKNHELFLKDLKSNTTYYYMIRARDEKTGKESWFEGRSFKTLVEGKSEIDPSAPVLPTLSFEDQIQKGITTYYLSKNETKNFDTSTPIIKVLEVRSIRAGSAAEIKWTTDAQSNSSIEYGGSWDYGFEGESTCKTKCITHSAILEGLAKDKKTFIRIYTSSPDSLDETNSGVAKSRTAHITFTLPGYDALVEVAPRDFTSPQISSVEVMVRGATSSGMIPVEFSVNTDEPARVEVTVDPEHDQSQTAQSLELRRQSTIQFSNLSPGLYHFLVLARDADINKTSSRFYTFRVPVSQNISAGIKNTVSAPLILAKDAKVAVTKKNGPKKIVKKNIVKKNIVPKKNSKKKISVKKNIKVKKKKASAKKK